MAFQMRLILSAWRLCMSPFVGSSRRILDTMIVSSRSSNHPFGRNHERVCVGEGGILKNVAIPIAKVMEPLYKGLAPDLDQRCSQIHALDEKEISPACFAVCSAHPQDAECEETRDDGTDVSGHPEERESNGKFSLRVEI